MDIPTDDDWRSEPWCLDLDWAYKNFHGKSVAEAVQLLDEKFDTCTEDFLYMPGSVFRYYLGAYIAYLLSDAVADDPYAAESFVSLIQFRAEQCGEDIAPIWTEIDAALCRLAARLDQPEEDWAWAHGYRFREHLRAIKRLGFVVSIDTSRPELVPGSVALPDLPVPNTPWAIAVQILRNSGFTQLDANSRKEDILRDFGAPYAAGGGDHPQFGFIPYWARFRLPDFDLRFEFDGDAPSAVLVDGRWSPPEQTVSPAPRQ